MEGTLEDPLKVHAKQPSPMEKSSRTTLYYVEDRFYAAWCVDIAVVCFYTGLGKKGSVVWSCGLVVKALVAHASDPGLIPGDSRFFTSFLS